MEEKSNETHKQEAPQAASSSAGDNKTMAILCYLWFLVLIPLLTDAKNDAFVKFHIKQGLILLIAYAVAWVLFFIPALGLILGPVIYLVLFILLIMGIINASSGKQEPLPIIGKLADNLKI